MTATIVANIASPISSALSKALSTDAVGLLSSYGKLGAAADPDAAIKALFAAGEQGAWYDPSDLTTMFQDRAGTTPVTADGQTVGKILDKSGRGNHATAPSDSARPLYKTSGGLHWLLFDGINDASVTGSIDFSVTDKMSVFAGVRKNNDTTSVVAELSANSNTNAGTICLISGNNINTAGYECLCRGSAAAALGQIAYKSSLTAPHTGALSFTHDIAGDISKIWVNGAAGTNGTGDKGTGNLGNYPLYIGMRGGDGLPFNGLVYSMIITGRIATADEITATETWVNSKTGAY